jgi:hypothetical protein
LVVDLKRLDPDRVSNRISRNHHAQAKNGALLASMGITGCGGSGPSANSNSPTSPGTTSSITKDGITWTFRQAVPVGQFVNGDYYVVGPVTITGINPAPTRSAPYENGSVRNLPTANSKSGFDSRLNDGTGGLMRPYDLIRQSILRRGMPWSLPSAWRRFTPFRK